MVNFLSLGYVDDLQQVDISDLQLITIRRVTKSEHPTYKNKCKSDLTKSTSDLQKVYIRPAIGADHPATKRVHPTYKSVH